MPCTHGGRRHAALTGGLIACVLAASWGAPPARAHAAVEAAEPSPRSRAPVPPARGPAGATPNLGFDFESNGLVGWVPRPGDESHVKLEVREDFPLRGHWLMATVDGWNPVPPSREQVDVLYRLPEPVEADSTDEVSWKWWFQDREDNDGIGLSIWIEHPAVGFLHEISWASHSNCERGQWPFDDAEQRVHQHRETLGRVAAERRAAGGEFPPFPWRVQAVSVFFWFPQHQVACFDDIRIGPPDSASLASGESPVRASTVAPVIDLLVADLDQDRWPDWLEGCAGGPVRVLLGARHRDWPREGAMPLPAAGAGFGLSTAASMATLGAGDLDGDGRLDLVAVSNERMRLYRGLGSGHFREGPGPDPEDLDVNRCRNVIVADLLSGEGPEIAVGRFEKTFSRDSIYARVGAAGSRRGPAGRDYRAIRFPQPPPGSVRTGYRSATLPADVDNDFDLDLFATNTDLFLREGDSLVCVTAEWLPETGVRQSGAAFGDIDNDGDLDLFIAVDIRHGQPDAVTHWHSLLYRNDGDGFTDVSEWLPDGVTQHVSEPVCADFDLDGDVDFFLTQRRWKPTPPLPNLCLVNDGTGRFSVAGPECWLTRTDPASHPASVDFDGDGDADLLYVRNKDGRTILAENPRSAGSIKVRVLDRRGAPHAGGAHLCLRSGGGLAGYRQTGVGEMSAGWSEAVFGAPGAGPYELTVTFPSRPDARIVRRDLHAGSVVLVLEPPCGGLAGAGIAAAQHLRRRAAAHLAATGWPVLLLAGVLAGVILGAAAYSLRRILPAGRRAAGVPGSAGPAVVLPGGVGGRLGACTRWAALIGTALVLLAGLGTLPVWPEHEEAVRGARLAAAGLMLGLGVGGLLAHFDSSRRDALQRPPRDPDGARRELMIAMDGFTHAQWLQDLTGLANLASGLTEGASVERVLPRLELRLQAYATIIRPQLARIAALLDPAGIPPDHARAFGTQVAAIDAGVESIQEVVLTRRAKGQAGVEQVGPRVAAVSDATRKVSELVDRVFQQLGRSYRTDAVTELRVAAERVADSHARVALEVEAPAGLAPVFAVPGELANIFDNLLRNACRAALENQATRPPGVRVEVRRAGGLVIVRVWDSGRGLTPEQIRDARESVVIGPGRRGRGLPHAFQTLRRFDAKLDLPASAGPDGTLITVTLKSVIEEDSRNDADDSDHR